MIDPEALIEFEETHPGRDTRKDRAIRLELGLSATAYYAALHLAADDPDLESRHPVTVHRIQRGFATRSRKRAARIL